MSWRRLRNLVDRLGRESDLAREVHGDATAWGHSEHLLALVADLLAAANWQRQKIAVEQGGKQFNRDMPPLLRRPGAPEPKLSDADTIARLRAQQRR